MKYYYDTFATRMGDFTVALNDAGAVVATTFGSVGDLRRQIQADEFVRDPKRAARARQEIQEFFRGERRQFTVELAPAGTSFQKRVWLELQRIPYGETRSYGQVAAKIGSPQAARAVGRANATNPICVIVPCHRVIGSDGSLTGFGFGNELKRRLLEHEGAALPTLEPSLGI